MSTGRLKREKRLLRHKRNLEKDIEHKKTAWESGKLIKPNHNGNYYDQDYSIELGKRLAERLRSFKYYIESTPGLEIDESINWSTLNEFEKKSIQNNRFINRFRQLKVKSIEFILKFSQDIPKTDEYFYIKNLLEFYWDNPNGIDGKLLIDIV